MKKLLVLLCVAATCCASDNLSSVYLRCSAKDTKYVTSHVHKVLMPLQLHNGIRGLVVSYQRPLGEKYWDIKGEFEAKKGVWLSSLLEKVRKSALEYKEIQYLDFWGYEEDEGEIVDL